MTHKYLKAYVEIPLGGELRKRINEEDASIYKGNAENVPAFGVVAYGCIPDYINPTDNCEADVFIIDSHGLEIGNTIEVKIIGVHIRNNGDHKVLCAPANSTIKNLSDINSEDLQVIGKFVEKESRPGEFWAKSDVAYDWLESLKTDGQQ